MSGARFRNLAKSSTKSKLGRNRLSTLRNRSKLETFSINKSSFDKSFARKILKSDRISIGSSSTLLNRRWKLSENKRWNLLIKSKSRSISVMLCFKKLSKSKLLSKRSAKPRRESEWLN